MPEESTHKLQSQNGNTTITVCKTNWTSHDWRQKWPWRCLWWRQWWQCTPICNPITIGAIYMATLASLNLVNGDLPAEITKWWLWHHLCQFAIASGAAKTSRHHLPTRNVKRRFRMMRGASRSPELNARICNMVISMQRHKVVNCEPITISLYRNYLAC